MSNQMDTERVSGFHDTRAERGDVYVYQRFTEHSHPELAAVARQVHALGYRGEGFINDQAIVDDGTIAPDIDKARGQNVQYYLGFEQTDNGERIPRSTLRKVSIPYGGTLEDLPAYQLAGETFYPEELEALRRLPYPHRTLKEISAFAHTPEVGSAAGLEILRTLLQDGLGSGEKWIFTMVEPNFKALVRLFGPKMMHQIGEPVPIDDPRVENVHLVSAMVDADLFLQQIRDSAEETDIPQLKRRYVQSLTMLTEGLSTEEMGKDVAEMVEIFRSNKLPLDPEVLPVKPSSSDLGLGALLQLMKKEPTEWQQPDQFDLNSWADRREVQRRIEGGRITSVSDASIAIADELFELRHPKLKTTAGARQEFVDTVEAQGIRFGQWFHFPWNSSLVRFADQADHQELRTFRNRNMITAQEQLALLQARVAIVGLSVGSNIASELLHAGVGGSMVLADGDRLSVTNLNRIKAGMLQVGQKKTARTGQEISELDPYINQVHLDVGFGEEYWGVLVDAYPQIIFDEVDNLATKVLLRAFAERQKIPLVMATDVGHKSIIDVERHDLGQTAPFNGRLDAKDIQTILAGELSPEDKLKITTKLVGMKNASVRLLESTMDTELAGLPQLGTTASLGGVLGAIIAPDLVLGRPLKSGRSVISPRRNLGLKNISTMSDTVELAKQLRARRKSR